VPWKKFIYGYGITEDNYVMLGINNHNYSSNLEVLDKITKYKKVVLLDSFNSPIDFLPDGVIELILGQNYRWW